MLSNSLKNLAPPIIKSLARHTLTSFKKLLFIGANYLSRANKRPVFILGNQKSGTSVIASLLSMCTGMSVSVDLRREVGKQYYLNIANKKVPFKKLIARNRQDFSREIIKEPNLTLFYSDLRRSFPDAKYIMVIRDPRDNIRSILNRVAVPGNLEALDKGKKYNIDSGFEMVLGPHWPCIKTMPHYIEQLAERWNYFYDIYTKNSDNIILVRYEDFNKHKEKTIIELAKALDIEPIHSIKDKVDWQFQSRGNREITWEEFFGYKNLSKIENLCSSRMKQTGYQ